MCAKLKCCLNYEVDDYVEASRKLPGKDVHLFTIDNEYFLFKSDILNGLCTYSTDKNLAVNLETISAERAKEIIEMNKQGEKPLSLLNNGKAKPAKKPIDLLAGADISRFDKEKTTRKNSGKARNGKQRRNNGNAQWADERRQNARAKASQERNDIRQTGNNRQGNYRKNNRRKDNNQGSQSKPKNED